MRPCHCIINFGDSIYQGRSRGSGAQVGSEVRTRICGDVAIVIVAVSAGQFGVVH